jgi:hypothetical protein
MPVITRKSPVLEVVAPTADEIAMSLKGVGHWFDGPLGWTQTLSDVNIQIKAGELFMVPGMRICHRQQP